MTPVREWQVETAGGSFRALEWGSFAGETVLFLHGLTAVAEVWEPTVKRLTPLRRYVAIDQRGHGDSPHSGPYHPAQFAADTRRLISALGAPVHLVGHSMGARIAILIAARHPELLRSATIVDIGVEASAANIRDTAAGIESMPRAFASEDEAFAFAFQRREPDDEAKAVFRARLRSTEGGLVWRGSPEAMVATVRSHRRRNYWREWRSVATPALYVCGGRSKEVSPAVYRRMRDANPDACYVEFPDVPHNVPLIAPDRLANELETFWASLPGGRQP